MQKRFIGVFVLLWLVSPALPVRAAFLEGSNTKSFLIVAFQELASRSF